MKARKLPPTPVILSIVISIAGVAIFIAGLIFPEARLSLLILLLAIAVVAIFIEAMDGARGE